MPKQKVWKLKNINLDIYIISQREKYFRGMLETGKDSIINGKKKENDVTT